jgi:Protein of unknown function (DUF1580)
VIDLESETAFRLAELPGHIPAGRNGRPIHVATVYRWATIGCRGVRLETITIGGCKYTSSEALRRFSDRLSGVPVTIPAPTPAVPTAAARRADAALTALGI